MAGVGLLFGPMLIGTFLNTTLFGVLVVQTFIYWQTYRKDATWIRYFVLYLLIVEALNTVFDIGIMYEPLIIRYGSARAVTVVPLMLSTGPVTTVALSTPVQLFVAWRIWVIRRPKIITFAICFFSACSLVGGISTTVASTIITEYARLQEFRGAVITWLASSAIADIIITTSLIWSLYTRKTGLSDTDHIVNRVIRLTVQTGALTVCAAIADVTLFLAVPSTTLNFTWDFALSKLYSNALMSTLNARGGWTNLAGTSAGNVLFIENGPSSNNIRNRQYPDPQLMAPGVYELQPPSSGSSQMKFGNDVEFGIVVTKVVERHEDDDHNIAPPESQ